MSSINQKMSVYVLEVAEGSETLFLTEFRELDKAQRVYKLLNDYFITSADVYLTKKTTCITSDVHEEVIHG